jgi:benzylsuccinate CoA-transferase BbsF subunit
MKLQNKDRLPLEDIVVLDFGWVVAGPHGARCLADLGATVIKVESPVKPDGIRGDFTRKGIKDGAEECGCIFLENNRNKYGISLNTKTEKGWEILERLVRIADVVTSNSNPKGLRSFGITYDRLREYNPGIISINASGLGDYGPYSEYVTYGPNLQSLCGINGLIGYPDEQPVGVALPWADYMGGAMVALAALAAIEYRKKTGKGQFIDLSQHESAISFLGTNLLDWAMNDRINGPSGNRHPANGAAPHGAYKCEGVDRWCVISVASDEEWDRFLEVIGNPGWTQDPKYSTYMNRLINRVELDKDVESWTVNHSPEEITGRLQKANVSAGVVQNVKDLYEHDEHLRKRGFLAHIALPEKEGIAPDALDLPGVIIRLMGKDNGIRRSGPIPLGQDNDFVYKTLLHMSDDEIREAAEKGAFSKQGGDYV